MTRLLIVAGLLCALVAIVTAAGWLGVTAEPTHALGWLAGAVAFNLAAKLA